MSLGTLFVSKRRRERIPAERSLSPSLSPGDPSGRQKLERVGGNESKSDALPPPVRGGAEGTQREVSHGVAGLSLLLSGRRGI